MKADFSRGIPKQRHGLQWESEEAWEHHLRQHLFTCQDTEDQNVYCHVCTLPLRICQQLSKVCWVLITGKQKKYKTQQCFRMEAVLPGNLLLPLHTTITSDT
jgi:hypothetical protein